MAQKTEISEQELLLQQQCAMQVQSILQDRLQRAPKAFVHTYGCQGNVADSERMKGMLCEMGYTFCDTAAEADLILYNTCAVREHAEDRVFGSGTVLDTARFRTLLGYHLGVSPKSLHANVLGEHGDSEVLIWSNAVAGTVRLEQLAHDLNRPLPQQVKNEIDDNVRNAAYKIIDGKGSTTFGIAGALCRICQAIDGNEYAVLNVSAFHHEVEGVKEICMSMPCIIGKRGIHNRLYPDFSPEEHESLKQSAETIKGFTETALACIRK